MKITSFTLIPVLIAQLFGFFIVNVFRFDMESYVGFSVLEYGNIKILLLLIMILIVLDLIKYTGNNQHKLRKRIKRTSILGLIVTIILENSNKFSLCVLFVIGLSAINILHLGFMLFFLVFILNSNLSKKYWILLVIYTQLVLLIRYV